MTPSNVVVAVAVHVRWWSLRRVCVGLEAAIVISVDEYRDQYFVWEHEHGSSSVLLSWVEVRSSSKTDQEVTKKQN